MAVALGQSTYFLRTFGLLGLQLMGINFKVPIACKPSDENCKPVLMDSCMCFRREKLQTHKRNHRKTLHPSSSLFIVPKNDCRSGKIRHAETTILIKFAFSRGSGKNLENGPKTLFFQRKSMTKKIGSFANFIVRHFVVTLEAPKKWTRGIQTL